MKASLLVRERLVLSENAFAELVLWRLPKASPGSVHPYKYRLAYVRDEECLLRYDNEAGKGDHRHFGTTESNYSFTNPETLLRDFWADVDRWRSR